MVKFTRIPSADGLGYLDAAIVPLPEALPVLQVQTSAPNVTLDISAIHMLALILDHARGLHIGLFVGLCPECDSGTDVPFSGRPGPARAPLPAPSCPSCGEPNEPGSVHPADTCGQS